MQTRTSEEYYCEACATTTPSDDHGNCMCCGARTNAGKLIKQTKEGRYKMKKKNPVKLVESAEKHIQAANDEYKAALTCMVELAKFYVNVVANNTQRPQKAATPEKPVKAAEPAAPAKKRHRRTKAEMEAARAAEQADKSEKRAKTVKITKEEADAAKPSQRAVHHRTPASVRLTPHEITLNIGSQPVKELADNDAKEFLNNPKIFWYRGMQFPDPKRYSIQPRIEGVRVVKRTDPKFTRAPWTCSVTIATTGDDKRCENWNLGVLTKNKSEQE